MTPAPTVRPPSRMAKREPDSSATGEINSTCMLTLSPGMTISTPAGMVIEPVMSEGGLFKASGRMSIWVTADERRMPVLMKSKIPVGSIDAVLQEYRSGGPAVVADARP